MNAKTSGERQKALRESRQSAGLKEVRNLWCRPEDEAAIRAYAAKLQRKRGRKPQSPAPSA